VAETPGHSEKAIRELVSGFDPPSQGEIDMSEWKEWIADMELPSEKFDPSNESMLLQSRNG
jgi:hypothetical protein